MSNSNDRYLLPAYASPRSPQQSTFPPKATPTNMSRSASSDPHRVLGYFDLPSRSAPSSPQTSYLPYNSPVSRSSSPARDPRRSRDFNYSHSGSDLEDALVGFSLVPNWLKMAMEQDQNPNASSSAQKSTTASRRPHKYSPLNSPDSLLSSSNDVTPVTPRTPQLALTIPRSEDQPAKETQIKAEDEDRRYWEEEDEGYFGEMEEDEQDEDLEEAYRSVL